MAKAKIEDDIFYIHINEPVEIRRTILENSRQVVQLLQRYETLRQLRVQKSETTSNLKKNFKELVVLVNKLKQEMPKVGARVKLKQEKGNSAKKGVAVKRTVSGGEINKLEDELRMIESKLNGLS